jgi:Fic family protein
LISLLLVEWGLLPLPLLYLSAYFERQRQTYYDLLWRVSADGDWRSWTLFFLHGVAEQTRDAGARAKRLQDLQAEWRAHLIGVRSSTVLLRLVDELFRTPIITLPQVQRILAVTHRSATLAVERMTAEGFLELLPGRMRNRQYVARQILDIVENESL